MTTYLALLRGINVGGHKKVPMADLRAMLEKAGYRNVRTVLATGNVLFESPDKDVPGIQKELARRLADTFGFDIPVILRPYAVVEQLLAADPFQNAEATGDTRLLVSFLGDPPQEAPALPHVAGDGAVQVIALVDNIACTVLDLSKKGTVDAMRVLEMLFGKNITTRTWNTVRRIAAK